MEFATTIRKPQEKRYIPPLDDEQPRRYVFSGSDLNKWLGSKAYEDYMNYILKTNKLMKSTDNDYKNKENEFPLVIKEGLIIIQDLDKLVDSTPLEEKKSLQRFGNPAYRTWFDKMKKETPTLIQNFLKVVQKTEKIESATWKELSMYVSESFGNRTRIDYGSGHEASFGFFMASLEQLGLIKTDDEYILLITQVFNSYLKLVRKIQKKYMLEPAGSHGCWGLDDFQFLPYLFGSSQLLNHHEITVRDFNDEKILKTYKNKYLFLDCIQNILDVKTGPFREHSAILFSLLTVKTWTKINTGMIKMYNAEVLKKYVVIQHFLFGKLMKFEEL